MSKPLPPRGRDVVVASTVAHAFRDTVALLDALQGNPGGLDAEQIRARLQRDGLNEVSREKPPHWSLQLLRAFRNPFIVVLLVLAGVQLVHPPLRPLALTLFRALATIP